MSVVSLNVPVKPSAPTYAKPISTEAQAAWSEATSIMASLRSTFSGSFVTTEKGGQARAQLLKLAAAAKRMAAEL